MHIITVNGKERDGAYSVKDDDGEQVLYIFQQEDDAIRYAMQLEDKGYPEMHVIEVDDTSAVHVCENNGYRYSIITKDDIVIPPEELDHDLLSED